MSKRRTGRALSAAPDNVLSRWSTSTVASQQLTAGISKYRSGQSVQRSTGDQSVIYVQTTIKGLLHTQLLFIGLAVPPLGYPLRPEADAQELVRSVIANELNAKQQDHTRWMYVMREEEPGKEEVREVIQTNGGLLYCTLSRGGRPLDQSQQREEDKRIGEFLQDKQQQKKARRNSQQDTDKTLELLRILPDAFSFAFDGKAGPYLRMSFFPNGEFHPATREARILHTMQGTMLVHPVHERLVEITGTLMKDVKFGVGILGIIRKGGTFQVRQDEILPGQWKITLIDVHLRGRALIFHSINERQHQTFSNFLRVPNNLSLAQGAAMLKESQSRACLKLRAH
jgi:hypothetical protein